MCQAAGSQLTLRTVRLRRAVPVTSSVSPLRGQVAESGFATFCAPLIVSRVLSLRKADMKPYSTASSSERVLQD